jgi:IS6 family transposase
MENGCATGVTLPDLARGKPDETYVKVNGRWAYLYRAVDSRGRTVDFISPVVTAKLHTGFWVKSSTT